MKLTAFLTLGIATSLSAWSQTNTFPSSGNVGIGTNTPGVKLEVVDSSITASSTIGVFRTPNLANDNRAALFIGRSYGSTGESAYLGFTANAVPSSSTLNLGFFGSNNLLNIKPNGNVGIGTVNPTATLSIKGGTGTAMMHLGSVNGTHAAISGISFAAAGPVTTANYALLDDPLNTFIGRATGGSIYFRENNAEQMILQTGGNVGIGTTNPTHKLAVDGTIRAKEIIVDTGWADYVFEKDYRLAPLSEVKAHIAEKGHLPGIPSAIEVAERGVSLGDVQSKLLAKIEELTLHLIAQEERMQRIEKENAALRAEIIGIRP